MKYSHDSQKKIKSYYFGIVSELAAVLLLRIKGYKILVRRYKTRCGEIDIIACKGNLLIAVEVKGRNHMVEIDELLLSRQKKRIKMAMEIFLDRKARDLKNFGVRFDLIIIQPYKMPVHLKNFWE